jgi:DNA-directed RNA polymerase
MNPLDYLTARVEKVVVNSDKIYNEGARLLAHYPTWEYELERFINEAWDTLLRYCIRNKNAKFTATVKLTFASDLIGKRVVRAIGGDESDIKSTLAIGDLLLETFLQDGLIDIFREYNGIKAPYMVRIVNQTCDLKPTLIGTVFEPPLPITGLFSSVTKEPFIKGWTNGKLFYDYLDRPFVKALETLRQQPWALNNPLLTAIQSNPPPEVLSLVDADGEIHQWNIHHENLHLPKKLTHTDGTAFAGKKDPKLQRLVSKYFEYVQVVRKAELVQSKGYPFYQEVSCDYRGRIYYAESFLEFQGSDLARSLFLFHNKKVVDQRGFYWLCIHAASCFNRSFTIEDLRLVKYFETDYISYLQKEGLDTISVDKMTLDDRYKWVIHNMDMVKDVSSRKLIMDYAEKPYSWLAVCMEITKYYDCKKAGIPCLSGFPVPIDGSNNGWQHLAAMSKDAQAGELVSLTNTPIQKDFYVAVAKELITLMPEWFSEKKIPMKHIRKGIAKRGSMTRAYSAGRNRIAKNMYDDCHMEGYTVKYSINENMCGELAKNLIEAINTVCAGPLQTTKYLQKIAEHELNNGRNSLSWHTPSGFPVVYKAFLQHERKQRGTIKGIDGNKDGRVMHVLKVDVLNQETGEKVPCRRSFASGISPNVVHSYDAAHMANTIVAFNGSFAAVHDSFSVHASEVDFLQDVTKMTFIAQYDVDNFFDILMDTLMLHKDTFDFPKPATGSLNLKEVNESKYFFC